MPTGMNENQARALAAQIEAEDTWVKAIARRCASENKWYEGKTWEVIALLPDRNLKRRCSRPQEWTSIKQAWSELMRREVHQ